MVSLHLSVALRGNVNAFDKGHCCGNMHCLRERLRVFEPRTDVAYVCMGGGDPRTVVVYVPVCM